MASKSSGSSSRSAVREALTGGTTPKDKGPPVADGVLSTESTTDAIASPLDVERPCFLDDEAEEGAPSPSGLYGKVTWRLENFSEISKRELRSNVFEVGGYKWYILVYPQGCDVCNHLSLFLCVADYDKLLPGWSHFAQFTIAVTNKDPKKSKYSDTLHRFCKKEHDWGWKKFMELSKVLDGFTVSDTLIIKAQVQVILDKPAKPFRCLNSSYRRELVRVYLSNVEGVCRRFCDDKRARLAWVRDHPQRFKDFWKSLPGDQQRQLLTEKADVILKGIVKQFFNEKEVTSTLVMDALFCGCKVLADLGKAFFEGTLASDAEAPLVLLKPDRNQVQIHGEVLDITERVSKDFIPPPKEDKSGANADSLALRSGQEHDCRRDSIERDEKRLAELGRKTVEMFVISHICADKLEIAYREAEALKRQDLLILEEREQQLQEEGRRKEQAEKEREKKAKKKAKEQERNKAKKEAEDAEKKRQTELKQKQESERRAKEAEQERQAEAAMAAAAAQRQSRAGKGTLTSPRTSSSGGAANTATTNAHPTTANGPKSTGTHIAPHAAHNASSSSGANTAGTDAEIKAVRGGGALVGPYPAAASPRGAGMSRGASSGGAESAPYLSSMGRYGSVGTSNGDGVGPSSEGGASSASESAARVSELQGEVMRLRQRAVVLEEQLHDRDQLVTTLRAQVSGLQAQLEQQRQQQAAAVAAAVANAQLQQTAALAASAALASGPTATHTAAHAPAAATAAAAAAAHPTSSMSASVTPSVAHSVGSRHSSSSSLDKEALNELLAGSYSGLANGLSDAGHASAQANGGSAPRTMSEALQAKKAHAAEHGRGNVSANGGTGAWGGVRHGAAAMASASSLGSETSQSTGAVSTGTGQPGGDATAAVTRSGSLGMPVNTPLTSNRRTTAPDVVTKAPTGAGASNQSPTPHEPVAPSYRNAAAGVMASAAAANAAAAAAAAVVASQQAKAPAQEDAPAPPASQSSGATSAAALSRQATAQSVSNTAGATNSEYNTSTGNSTAGHETAAAAGLQSAADAFKAAAGSSGATDFTSQRPGVLALPPQQAPQPRSSFTAVSGAGQGQGSTGAVLPAVAAARAANLALDSPAGCGGLEDDFAHMGLITDLLDN